MDSVCPISQGTPCNSIFRYHFGEVLASAIKLLAEYYLIICHEVKLYLINENLLGAIAINKSKKTNLDLNSVRVAHIHTNFSGTKCNVTMVPLLALEDLISFWCIMKANLGENYNSYCSTRMFIYINAPTDNWQAHDHAIIFQFISISHNC